jgi:DNA-binding Lrp family transcriptional regulator
MDLDAIDRRIVAALQEDGRLSNVELAERSACRPPLSAQVRQASR